MVVSVGASTAFVPAALVAADRLKSKGTKSCLKQKTFSREASMGQLLWKCFCQRRWIWYRVLFRSGSNVWLRTLLRSVFSDYGWQANAKVRKVWAVSTLLVLNTGNSPPLAQHFHRGTASGEAIGPINSASSLKSKRVKSGANLLSPS